MNLLYYLPMLIYTCIMLFIAFNYMRTEYKTDPPKEKAAFFTGFGVLTTLVNVVLFICGTLAMIFA